MQYANCIRSTVVGVPDDCLHFPISLNNRMASKILPPKLINKEIGSKIWILIPGRERSARRYFTNYLCLFVSQWSCCWGQERLIDSTLNLHTVHSTAWFEIDFYKIRTNFQRNTTQLSIAQWNIVFGSTTASKMIREKGYLSSILSHTTSSHPFFINGTNLSEWKKPTECNFPSGISYLAPTSSGRRQTLQPRGKPWNLNCKASSTSRTLIDL